MSITALIILLSICFSLVLYFIPSIIALFRNHNNVMAIAISNLIFGWTILGWCIVLIWSFTDNI